MMKIFVTGAAGFIGYHLSEQLLANGHSVVGFDGLTDYYDVRLKHMRLARLRESAGFKFVEGMLEDADLLKRTLATSQPTVVVHLAAQAGVRYSIEQPQSYISSNLVGTANLLEAVRATPVEHFMFASTSSVYGGNQKVPFAETDRADNPVSLYAATKKSGEAMTHSYAHLWKIPTTCFRFFTVYGPWGRPDMALFKFVKAIEAGQPIDIYNQGQMHRDFTYIDDLVAAILKLMNTRPETGAPVSSSDTISAVAPWRVVNIAGGNTVGLLDFVEQVEASVGREAQRNLLPMQAGDMVRTLADPSLLQALIGQLPETPISRGVPEFVKWYRDFYAPLA